MKCIRKPLEAEVAKYELNKGMEDGFELWSDVVIKGWIVTDSLIKIKRENLEVTELLPAKSNNPNKHKSKKLINDFVINKYIKNILHGIIQPISLEINFFLFFK